MATFGIFTKAYLITLLYFSAVWLLLVLQSVYHRWTLKEKYTTRDYIFFYNLLFPCILLSKKQGFFYTCITSSVAFWYSNCLPFSLRTSLASFWISFKARCSSCYNLNQIIHVKLTVMIIQDGNKIETKVVLLGCSSKSLHVAGGRIVRAN